MYLKNIEVFGFKSFANKINFQFHNGITGIVGPNGSGKSNVADAVRWVLGEQRIKQLRGASMQDVIFSGTENRKPLSYAYVAITLDNSDHQLAIDFEEVTVARRIYRSGESEYLINGAPCRLKDVNELFYDTGIGKEGYSIIGQGQIDKILSGKPEERRELFDEAAGIVKFKRRKTTALKKLDDEKQNLVRVNDILTEIEKQVGPLEKQSEVAKVYLKKKEELKTLDVNMFLLENNRIKEQLESTQKKYGIASSDLDLTTAEYESIKTEYENVQVEIEGLDEQIELARTSLTDSSVLRGKLEGEINVLKEQINSAMGNEQHLTTRLTTVLKEVEEKNEQKDSILEQKAIVDEQLRIAVQSRDEANSLLIDVQKQMEELNSHIESGKNQIIQSLNDRATIKSKLGRFDSMMEQINIRKAELNSRLLRAKTSEAQQDEIIKELEVQFELVNEEIRLLDEKQAAYEQNLSTYHDELSSKDQLLRTTQENYHQQKSKLDAISNLTERYEGYGNSIRRVMEQKESEKGIVGVVADIIKVEKKYEIAIETALGGNIQNIVTQDESTAKKMITFLKKNKFGRATFLPLTSITKPQEFKTPEVLEETGVIGMADSLVKIDKEYLNVAKAMLGRIVIVDTVDHAMQIAKKYDYGIRMVTLEGELLVPGGAISGGAFKNNSNLLGRRREVEELTAQAKKSSETIELLKKEIEEIKERRNQTRIDLEDTKNKLQQQFILQNTARLNVVKAQERKEEVESGFEELQKEELDLKEQSIQIIADKENITKELEHSELLEKEIDTSIKGYQKELESLRDDESAKTTILAELELNAEKMRQQQEFQQVNVDRIQGEVDKFEEELNQIKEALQQNTELVAQKNKDIEQIEETILASNTSQSDSQEKLRDNIAKREELSAKQKNFFKSREEMSEKMSVLDKEVYRLQAQKEKLEDAISYQINYMWDEYEITLSDAASLRNEEMIDLGAMKKEVVALKEQIRKLGDVNVNAIEDYKNLMERYQFLKTQHDDLVIAEQTLIGIIDELDAAMRKQFKEKFAEICHEFDKVFKELFGGGKGTLELMEEEDILEAGIRIIAQPPGKKLQNMMQLSGGEKALTAIALLFAIQNLKPSPFCLLDEIEAALDESNVGRFAKYLSKLTKHTQFIVITHRRGTMERADRLYGITMQEKGVSALVSVNLIDKQLDD